VLISCVMGFYSPVEDKLKLDFGDEVVAERLVLLGSPSARRLNDLKLRLFNSLLKVPKARVIILYSLLRGEDWVTESVDAVAASAREKFGHCTIEIHPFSNPQNANGVIQLLNACGLSAAAAEITPEQVKKYLADRKVLFVRSDIDTGLNLILQRANIDCGECRSAFQEVVIKPGKNSNLNGDLAAKGNSATILLYVWKRLRTLKSETKQKYSHAIEGDSSAKVIALLRKELERVT
jgi:hypothetical protein